MCGFSVFLLTMSSQKPLNLRIIIVGAGMGGLSAALALAKQGFQDITVFEASSKLAEVGAGINITPNLSRVLDSLGVWGSIMKSGVALRGANIYSE